MSLNKGQLRIQFKDTGNKVDKNEIPKSENNEIQIETDTKPFSESLQQNNPSNNILRKKETYYGKSLSLSKPNLRGILHKQKRLFRKYKLIKSGKINQEIKIESEAKEREAMIQKQKLSQTSLDSSDEDEKDKKIPGKKLSVDKKGKWKTQGDQVAQTDDKVEGSIKEKGLNEIFSNDYQISKMSSYSKLLKPQAVKHIGTEDVLKKGKRIKWSTTSTNIFLLLLNNLFPRKKSLIGGKTKGSFSVDDKQRLDNIRKLLLKPTDISKSKSSEPKLNFDKKMKEKPETSAKPKKTKKVMFTGFLKCLFQEYQKKKLQRKKERKQQVLEVNRFKKKERKYILKQLQLLTKSNKEVKRQTLPKKKTHFERVMKKYKRKKDKLMKMEWWMWMMRNAEEVLKKQHVNIEEAKGMETDDMGRTSRLKEKDKRDKEIRRKVLKVEESERSSHSVGKKEYIKKIHLMRVVETDLEKEAEEEQRKKIRLEKFEMDLQKELDNIELMGKIKYLKSMKKRWKRDTKNKGELVNKLKFIKIMEKKWLGSKIDLIKKEKGKTKEKCKQQDWKKLETERKKRRSKNKEDVTVDEKQQAVERKETRLGVPVCKKAHLVKIENNINYWSDVNEHKANLKDSSFRNNKMISCLKFLHRQQRNQRGDKPSIAQISINLSYLQFKREQCTQIARKELKNIVGASEEEVSLLNNKLKRVKALVRENNWDPKYLPVLVVLSKKVGNINKNKGRIKTEIIEYYLDGINHIMKVIKTITEQLFVTKIENQIFYNKIRKIINKTKIFLINQIHIFNYLKSVLMNMEWTAYYYTKIRILRKLDCFIRKIKSRNYRIDEELLFGKRGLQERSKLCENLLTSKSEQSDCSSSTY